MQDTNSESCWDNHHQTECNLSLFHVIKHHPLRILMERLQYRTGGGETSFAGTVSAQRGEAFSAYKRNELNLAEKRNSNVEEKVTVDYLVTKVSVRSQRKNLPVKETSKKRNRHQRISSHDLEEFNLDPFSETILTYESPRTKRCVQCDATPNRDHSEHNMVIKHQQIKTDSLVQEIKDEKQCIVEDKLTHPRRHKSFASTHFLKQVHFDNNKDLLFTFLQDPVSSLVYHFHKQHIYRKKMILNRSATFPIPHKLLKRHGSKVKSNYSLPKEQGKFCFGNKTQQHVQFEPSKISHNAKLRACGNFDASEAMIVGDANSSIGSDKAQNEKEIKHFKSLKQKIEHVTGDSRKEKIRVTMDAVIDKLPQGQGISDDLNKEIFKKLTETTQGEYCPSSYNESNPSTHSITKHHRHGMRRIWSLQEPLETYCQFHENSFNTEATNPQYEELKLRTTEKAHSELSMMVPSQRILSLPDLQSFSYAYQNGNFSDILSQTKPIMDSEDGTLSSESITYQKDRLDPNVQLEKTVENLVQESLFNLGENDLRISTIVQSRSDSSSEVNGHNSVLHSFILVDSKSKPGPVDTLDNVAEQKEANKGSLKVTEATENPQKVEIQSKHLNYDIPQFQVDTRHKADFNYVKYVLEISGLTGNDCHSAWHSSDHPVDPLLYEEMEGDPEFCTYEGGKCNDHHTLFDLINETLLEIHGRSYGYSPDPRAYVIPNFSYSYPCNIGCHTLHQVWTRMSKSLCLRYKGGQKIDDHVRRDLELRDEWVNLKLFAQSVGLELEDLIFHDLLQEIVSDLSCF